MAGIVRVSDPPLLGTRDPRPVDCLREGNERKPKSRVLSEFRDKGVNPIAALTDIEYAIYMR